jgi:hypothetical protein
MFRCEKARPAAGDVARTGKNLTEQHLTSPALGASTAENQSVLIFAQLSSLDRMQC